MIDNKKIARSLYAFIAVLIIAVVAIAAVAITSQDKSKEARNTSQEIAKAIVKSCEENGNPQREVLQEILEENIKSAEDRDLIERALPNLDHATITELIEQQVKINVQRLEKIEPINCKNQYP